MSDGVEESEKHAALERARRPDDYGRATTRIAVAQICEGVGFDCVKESALEALLDIAVRYICDLGKSASLYASLAGRSEVNAVDIVKGLEDLGSTSGLARSGVVKEMADFVGTVEEIPFAQPIPRFPVVIPRKLIPSFAQMGEAPSGAHIPSWLPALPDPHTYIHSTMWKDRSDDIRTDKTELVRQRRKAEKSLLSLQQRLMSNGLAGPSGSGRCHVDVGNGLEPSLERNPFVAPPLQAGEKDVSAVPLPSKVVNEEKGEKKRSSLVETFRPAIDAIKGGGSSEPMELDRRTVPKRRPVVQFKLKAGKKMLAEDVDVNLRSRSNGRRGLVIARDEDKDDKKRRAELILRQSMENCQELS